MCRVSTVGGGGEMVNESGGLSNSWNPAATCLVRSSTSVPASHRAVAL